jgi:predicted Zn-dependent protease
MRPVLLGMIGSALYAEGRYAECVAPLEETVRINTTAPQAWAVLAATYARLGETARARAALETARAQTSLTLAELARNVIRQDDFRERLIAGIKLAESAPPP